MALSVRQREILEIARGEENRVTVEDLARRYGVSLQTIRRDLSELAEAGKLMRVHGGAILASSTVNFEYEARRSLNAGAKERIARACAALVPDNCSLFLNIGTTTEAVAAALVHHENILVVTNNINVTNILVANPSCEIVVTSGTLRRSDGGLMGALTMDTVRQFKFDHAIIGCSALDEDGDLLDFDVQEVGVSQCALSRSRLATVVADNSKFHRNAPARIGSLGDVGRFITDRAPPARLARLCREWSTEVILA